MPKLKLENNIIEVQYFGVFLAINDNLPMDVENLQMLWCIIHKTNQTSVHNLCQKTILRKGFIKYNKLNGIIPMKTHIEFTHPMLVVDRKLVIKVEKSTKAKYNQ